MLRNLGRRRNKGRPVLALLMSALAGPAAAALAYAEPPDLPQFATNDPPLALQLGANTVTGSFVPADFDSFRFVVPAGGLLTAITFAYATADAPDTYSSTWLLCPDDGISNPSSCVGSGADPLAEFTADLVQAGTLAVFAAALPLGSGTYAVRHGSQSTGDYSGDPLTTYTWTLTVGNASPVPEPATAALSALGLAVIAGRRRRIR